MTRSAGQILIVAEDTVGLAALELALVRNGVSVLRSEPGGAARTLEKAEPALVIVDPRRLDPRTFASLEVALRGTTVVALVDDQGPEVLRLAMSYGARDWIETPQPETADADAARLLELMRRHDGSGGQRRIREAETMHRLKQQVRDLTERYVRQCRTFDEAQDVFYLDLGRMMTIFDNIMDGIVFTDPEGQVTLMNPMAEDLLGVKTIFAIGKSVRELGPGVELVEEIARDHQRALIDGGISERTLEVHQKAHDLLYLKLRTTAVTDYKGSFAGILTVIKDVTAEFTSEQMKNQYLSIVSHELRTPLTGIKSFATVLAKGILGVLPARQQEVVDMIREQTLRLEHEIDKLICLGRIESGDFALDREMFELAGLLDTVTAPFGQIARDRDIEFCVTRDEPGPAVLADRENLRRAVQALVENAIKFTPNGGRVEIFFEETSDEIAVHVKDNGPGINPRYHGRIFEKFFQVEDPLTRHYGGAGVGLSVAQGVARAHDGRIDVTSELGKGADFRIWLPKRAGAAVPGAESCRAESCCAESYQAGIATIRKEQ